MEKSANYPYHLLRMIYSFYIYAGTASFGGSHPNAFNFFKYAWIFRSVIKLIVVFCPKILDISHRSFRI